MSKQTRVRLVFAGLGLAVTGIIVAYQFFIDYSSPHFLIWPWILAFIFCPPSLLSIPLSIAFFDAAETGEPGFYVIWMLVGLLNSALYAGIGPAVWGRRNRADRPVTG
jgi:hypothetical protein